MADCEWRLIRSRYIETATLDIQIEETEELIDERFESIDGPSRVAYALRAYKTLREIQNVSTKKHSQVEPNSGHNRPCLQTLQT